MFAQPGRVRNSTPWLSVATLFSTQPNVMQPHSATNTHQARDRIE